MADSQAEPRSHLVDRIVSGGQAGVDRAALDAALMLGIACGGWCPAGRLAEDGVIDVCYPLRETPQRRYAQRTEWNVRDSDGTLILAEGRLSGGTSLTHRLAREYGKPCLVVDLSDPARDANSAADWIAAQSLGTLNVAGPRESQSPGIYGRAIAYLRELLQSSPRR